MIFFEKMKEFNELYQQLYLQYNEELEELEKLREKAQKEKEKIKNSELLLQKLYLILEILAILFMPCVYYTSMRGLLELSIIFVFGFIFLMCLVIYCAGLISRRKDNKTKKYEDMEREYSNECKARILNTIVKSYSNNLEYIPKKRINEIYYIDSEFDGKSREFFFTEDYISRNSM